MLPLLSIIVADLFLIFANVATAQGLSDQQQCLLNCSVTAVAATSCDIQDTACVCASSVYATNLTQCATSACSVSMSDTKGFIAQGCAGDAVASNSSSASGSSSATQTGSAPESSQSGQSGKGNSAESNGVRIRVAAVSAAGLVFFALLV
ncbi:hypothetical protein C8R44DRAFT_866852 [Mycena epipterygia]|nr:hypothetical protein C8R44DRAFT_866852 [Mycena epipterygia]